MPLETLYELSREDKEKLAHLLDERERRHRARLISEIRSQRQLGYLTPETVAKFAYLTVRDEVYERPIEPAAHHWLWLELLTDPNIRRLLIIAPPESAKTTWIISAYFGCSIGFAPEASRIIACVAGDVAAKRSLSLRTLVESSEFHEIFPEVQRAKGMKYDQDEWSVAPNGKARRGRIHPTVFATGTGGSITGARAREMVSDDLLDYDNTRTKHQRNTTLAWVHNSLFSRSLSQVGRIIVIGTAWHHDDAYAHLRKAGDFVVCHMPLLSETDEFYANLYYPVEFRGRRLGEPIGVVNE